MLLSGLQHESRTLPQVLVWSLELTRPKWNAYSLSQGVPCKGPWVANALQSWAGWHRSHFPMCSGAYGKVQGIRSRKCNRNSSRSAGPPNHVCFSFSKILLFISIPFHFLFLIPGLYDTGNQSLQMYARQTHHLLSFASHSLISAYVQCVYMCVHRRSGRCMWGQETALGIGSCAFHLKTVSCFFLCIPAELPLMLPFFIFIFLSLLPTFWDHGHTSLPAFYVPSWGFSVRSSCLH